MSAKYQAYEEYKDSGVEMLGALPSIWCTKQVRYLLKDGSEGIKIGPFGSALKLEDMVDSGTRVYGQENVIKKDFTLGKRKISQSKFEEMKVYQAFTDDLLITMMGTSGKCELVPEDADVGIIDSHLLRLRVKESEILPRFFRLLIDECYEIENQIKVSGKGSIMHGLNSSIVKSLTLPVPNPSEQIAILNFLDHETAKIDTLIEKQQQLIKLLKEKRQAVISHAVTKGLNPNAPMRDSGVEWLGEVPEHWDVLKTKRFFSLECHHAPINNDMELLSVYTDIGVRPRKELEQKGNKASTTDGYWIVKKDDLIINKLLAWMGAIGYSDYDGVTSPAYDILRKRRNLNTKFYHYLFRTKLAQSEFKRWSRGIMEMRLRLYFEELGKISMPFPPEKEQNEIVSKIEKLEAQYDEIIEKSDTQIKLLQERRTALISAAVTGKIDVRNWQSADG